MAIPSQDLKVCGKCKETKPLTEYYSQIVDGKKYLMSECKECSRSRSRERYRNKKAEILAQGRVYIQAKRAVIKDEVFNAYGGYVCACCGETEKMFLSIDHMNNDGAVFRRKISGKRTAAGYHTYIWLKKHGFPSGHQVLCMNCNHGKRMNKGICPHKGKV